MDNDDSNEPSGSSNVPDTGKPEDPEPAGIGKLYKAQTPTRKEMVNTFGRFCDLTHRDTNAIVMYFGVYSKTHLAEFLHEHWKDILIQWQKHNTPIETVLSG